MSENFPRLPWTKSWICQLVLNAGKAEKCKKKKKSGSESFRRWFALLAPLITLTPPAQFTPLAPLSCTLTSTSCSPHTSSYPFLAQCLAHISYTLCIHHAHVLHPLHPCLVLLVLHPVCTLTLLAPMSCTLVLQPLHPCLAPLVPLFCIPHTPCAHVLHPVHPTPLHPCIAPLTCFAPLCPCLAPCPVSLFCSPHAPCDTSCTHFLHPLHTS